LFVFALLLGSCAAPSTAPGASVPTTSAPGTPVEGLAAAPRAALEPLRNHYVLADGAFRDDPRIAVTFPDIDPSAGRPRARLRSDGRTVELLRSREDPSLWLAQFALDGAVPGTHELEILVRLRDGSDAVLATRALRLSAPEYVVWTLDFEGDNAGDAELANTAAIAERFGLPMTVMWNPRVWTTSAVSASRAEAMASWTKARAAAGHEVALHLHMWTDFVRAAGVAPRIAPSWAGRADGYDVPMTAYGERETGAMLDLALRLMADHGLPRPVTFRAGGQFANAANLRALAGAGFVADCSAVPAGTFGRLAYPWTLPPDAQPYRPSADDANAVGALARERRAITLVSHPSTINATERAAIETLFAAFDPLRYDRDAGPLRFVTLAQLAKAYGR
jgi:peptidoglycan/xylan/chitin deacetylase (PgdA/CDA1 family)